MTGSSDLLLDLLLDLQLSAFRWADNTPDPRWRHAKLLGHIKRMFRWISDKRCGSVESRQNFKQSFAKISQSRRRPLGPYYSIAVWLA